MPTVNRTSRANASAAADLPRRFVALKKMHAVVEKAGLNLPKAELEALPKSFYLTPNGNAYGAYVDERDEKKMGISSSRFSRFMIDDTNKEFFVSNSYESFGPFKLPRGVSTKDLFDDDSYVPRGKTKYEKSVSKLTRVVKNNMYDARMAGNTSLDFRDGDFRSPDGEALYHHYIDDDGLADRSNRFYMPGGALMLGKEQFWVEQIPGTSGDCIGPFDYPRGFSIEEIKAKDTRDDQADSASSASTFDNSSSRGSSAAYGGDSGSYRPAPSRSIGGGGSGSWPSSWGPSPGGGGS